MKLELTIVRIIAVDAVQPCEPNQTKIIQIMYKTNRYVQNF